jgi:hypothetical protein
MLRRYITNVCQCIRDNQRISADKTISEVSMTRGGGEGGMRRA